MSSRFRLQFLGATGTVTGSKYLLQAGDHRVLVDCGLFQGWKQLRLKNWAELPFPAHSLDAVLLTHAHIDHSGYLPVLGKRGFRFVGSTICYAFMQSAGLVNDHLTGCFRHAPVHALSSRPD